MQRYLDPNGAGTVFMRTESPYACLTEALQTGFGVTTPEVQHAPMVSQLERLWNAIFICIVSSCKQTAYMVEAGGDEPSRVTENMQLIEKTKRSKSTNLQSGRILTHG